MKKLYFIAILLLAAVGAYAQDGKNIYNRYSDSKGVSAVYISPAMFRLIGKIPELNVESEGGNVDLAPLIRTLDGFYMLDISEKAIIDEVASQVDQMVKKGRYEILMEVKDEGENVRMYTVGNDNTIESLVFIAKDDASVQFICIDGTMNRSDVENLIAQYVAE